MKRIAAAVICLLLLTLYTGACSEETGFYTSMPEYLRITQKDVDEKPPRQSPHPLHLSGDIQCSCGRADLRSGGQDAG